MPIEAIASAFPAQCYSQNEILAELVRQWGGSPEVERRLSAFHQRSGVARRHLALPKERYADLQTFTDRNREYVRVATDLASAALSEALERAELRPEDLGHLFFVSVTGVATPSVDARLVTRLGLNPHVVRTPIFGLGCVGGAAGLSRAADWALAYPKRHVALVALELCSLTWQSDDVSIPNLIGSSLFGDGCAALILRGSTGAAAGPSVLASRAIFFPDTEQVMGFDVGSHGMKLVLSSGVPALVRERIAPEVDAFLGEHGLARKHVDHWVLHTGGPRVLEAFESALGLGREQTELSWESLRENGNLSSASVLLVLGETCARRRPKPGSRGLVLAMGPGFCAEMLLVGW